jgi:CHASE3 domain sensor protein
MKQVVGKSLITVSIVVITVLMILNIIATQVNNSIIEENRLLQKQAEEIKVTVSQFAIVIIHNLDLGLRGYALFKDDKYLYPMRFALRDKDSLINVVERALIQQGYPLEELHVLKDSINAYGTFCQEMLELFNKNQLNEFHRLADKDKGYHLWLQYERFAKKLYTYENEINEAAQRRYHAAMQNNYLIQIFLLLICFPTLLFTAIHTRKKFIFEMKLRQSEAEKAEILSSQNAALEQLVAQRTQEIQQQNKELQEQHKEIAAQNEEIITQNEELNTHRETLASQNEALIESKKQQLDLYTQNILEKSGIISKVTEELELLKSKSKEKEQIEKFSRILDFTIITEEDWEKFKTIFQEVYPTFFGELRYTFPDITASELRLSALIKLNLSLKEAADTLGISAESVKKSRYRLKKKFGLQEEESLEDFIRKLT